jgi:NADH:ubiquinone oxidoreductase subunit C
VLATCFLNKVVGSIDYIYSNAAWLEREVGEMNELFFFNKFDTRKLLLNYSDNFAPLKNENFIKNKDLYYCVFENQVIGLNSAVVEL